VREAEKHVVETAHKKGIAARAEPGNPEMIERYVEMGIRHFCMGTDVALLFQWWKQNGARAREMIASL
jgi:4-hydroxy-2-oxoheptanedioate aldolase